MLWFAREERDQLLDLCLEVLVVHEPPQLELELVIETIDLLSRVGIHLFPVPTFTDPLAFPHQLLDISLQFVH